MSLILNIAIIIVLGFFTGILLSGNGIDIAESGLHILLGCIFWALIFLYGHMKQRDEKDIPK